MACPAWRPLAMVLVTVTLGLPALAAEPASPPPPTELPPGVNAPALDAEGAPVPETGYTEAAEAPCPPPGAAAIPATGWFNDWTKMKARLEAATGTTFDLCLHNQDQVVLTGPGKGRDRNTFWWHLNLGQKLWPGGKLIVSSRGGAGDGVSNLVGSKLGTDWMSNEPAHMYVSQLFIEQKLLDDRLTVMVGKIGIDNHFDTGAVGDWDFLSYALARNAGIPVPWHTLGAVVRYDATEWLYLQAGVADARGSPTESGFNTAFHGDHATFSMYEAGIRPRLGGRPGTYRFILWHDTRSIDRVDGTGSDRGDTGFGVSFDQEILDRTLVFFRYGHSHEPLRDVEHFWSAGLKRFGPIPGRPNDVLAVGFAQEIMGRDWRRANAHAASSESLFEMYYDVKLAPWCSVAPDVQVVLNPGANSRNDTAVILGVNLKLSF